MTTLSRDPQAEPDVEASFIRARSGDIAAFGPVVDHYRPAIIRYLTVRLGDLHEAEDVAQETFIRAFRRAHTFRPGRALTPWIFAIARNAANSAMRRRRWVLNDRTDDRPCGGPHPCDPLATEELRTNLWSLARHHLSERQFSVLWLHYAEELPVKQVASALLLSIIHTKVLLHRARKRLIPVLARHGFDAATATETSTPGVSPCIL